MKFEELPERSQIELDRIYSADSAGCGINATAICERYGTTFEKFRTDYASYDPVDGLQRIADRNGSGPVAITRDGEIWITKGLATSLLQFCDMEITLFVASAIADIIWPARLENGE